MSGSEGDLPGGAPVRGRSCGTCTACCTAVPVTLPDEDKPANVRCRHVGSRGCRIYGERPALCRAWSCRWLVDPGTVGMRRPDHAGYIIDPALNAVHFNGRLVAVVQVWVDPQRRAAHGDPALRAYLAAVAERQGLAAIIRWGAAEGMLLAAPCLTETGDWLEMAWAAPG